MLGSFSSEHLCILLFKTHQLTLAAKLGSHEIRLIPKNRKEIKISELSLKISLVMLSALIDFSSCFAATGNNRKL